MKIFECHAHKDCRFKAKGETDDAAWEKAFAHFKAAHADYVKSCLSEMSEEKFKAITLKSFVHEDIYYKPVGSGKVELKCSRDANYHTCGFVARGATKEVVCPLVVAHFKERHADYVKQLSNESRLPEIIMGMIKQ